MLAVATPVNMMRDPRDGYCLIVPDLSSHGEDLSTFQSTASAAGSLITYLKENYYDEIELLRACFIWTYFIIISMITRCYFRRVCNYT